jgi:Glu-tRNA(Gln) amidotransferase subunit E-like FAD-binding protein
MKENAAAENTDTYGYNRLSSTELRKIIADLVRSNEEVIANKKDMMQAANDTIKETKNKINAALVFLTMAERTGTALALEKQVDTLLRAAESKL